MEPEKLKKILELHKKWIIDHKKRGRADLKGADLKGAYLKGADLKGADLEGAHLEGADLEGADLEGAYLKGADLKWADLKGADLKWAHLEGAHLKWADLKWAHLEGADLKGAHLEGADLDFSSGFSFNCSSFGAIIDLRIGAQMVYHFCRMKSADPEVIAAQQALTDLANKFHRVKECRRIKGVKDDK